MRRKESGAERKFRYARGGNAARRDIEFRAIVDQVKRRKAQFIARLSARVVTLKNGCIVYRGTKTEGYPNITFKPLGMKGRQVVMKAHRVFGILKYCKPIPVNFDIGHLPGCHRRDCVLHIELQHFSNNGRQAAAKTNGHRCPF